MAERGHEISWEPGVKGFRGRRVRKRGPNSATKQFQADSAVRRTAAPLMECCSRDGTPRAPQHTARIGTPLLATSCVPGKPRKLGSRRHRTCTPMRPAAQKARCIPGAVAARVPWKRIRVAREADLARWLRSVHPASWAASPMMTAVSGCGAATSDPMQTAVEQRRWLSPAAYRGVRHTQLMKTAVYRGGCGTQPMEPDGDRAVARSFRTAVALEGQAWQPNRFQRACRDARPG